MKEVIIVSPFSMEQMDALEEALSKITAAIQKLVDAAKEWIENFRKLLAQIFPIVWGNCDFHGDEAKKECSAKAFILRILARPRRFWKKIIRRFTRHEADS